MDYGQWFDYVLEMEKEIEKEEHDIHLVYYEDLKEVFIHVFAKFLMKNIIFKMSWLLFYRYNFNFSTLYPVST